MFNHLIEKFLAKQTNEEARMRLGIVSGRVGLVSNLLLFIIKLIAGTMSGSISIITDGMNNLGDSASSLLTLFGFRAASKPADKEHPYGHERSEYITGLLISVIIIYVGIQFFTSSIQQILNPTSLNASPIVFALLVMSIIAKMMQGNFYRTAAKSIHSNTLHGAAQDSINDVYVTTIVLISAMVETFTGWRIDGYAGALLSIIIVYSGIQAINDSINDLLGTRPSKDEIHEMKELLDQYNSIVGYHDLLVHNYGPNKTFATIHIEIDDSWDMKHAHRVIHDIEVDFVEKLGVELVCHVDPIAIQNEEHTAIYRQVKQILKSLNLALTFHDFKVERIDDENHITFDVVVPDNVEKTNDELLRMIQEKIHQQIGCYKLIIEFDRLDLLKEV
ncbi:cation diffusion facilitator family transporter [Ruoffia tabacinasalis]|uniref:cation diffusion facilitator family transporter n=1 Tax=Ruoffia tabacinasalis TaxID=87458 RepID=UPI0030CBE2D8